MQHSKRRRLFTSRLYVNVTSILVECYVLSIDFYSAETWTLRKVEQK